MAVAARIERQQICNLWRHHPEGRRQVISSLCTAREFCLRSFGPADRRPSACSNLPPLPRQLLRSRIRLSASSWISGRMALAESSPSLSGRVIFVLKNGYLRFQVIFVFYIGIYHLQVAHCIIFRWLTVEDNSSKTRTPPGIPWLALPVPGARGS